MLHVWQPSAHTEGGGAHQGGEGHCIEQFSFALEVIDELDGEIIGREAEWAKVVELEHLHGGGWCEAHNQSKSEGQRVRARVG